jgi:hypothetical protein
MVHTPLGSVCTCTIRGFSAERPARPLGARYLNYLIKIILYSFDFRPIILPTGRSIPGPPSKTKQGNMQVKLKNIDPNPFRHIEHYPIHRDKVEALKSSFRTTGVWPVLLAREVEGRFQIPFAHHRLVALKEEYGPGHEITLNIMDLDDTAMIQMMANENMEEWGTSALVELETVQAVVEAFGAGKIKLEKPGKTNGSRCAPSFLIEQSKNFTLLYNAQTIGKFLGWVDKKSGQVSSKIDIALTALQYIEEGLVTLEEFKDLKTSGIQAVVAGARKARQDEELLASIQKNDAKKAREKAEELEKAEAKARAEAERFRKERKEEAAAKADQAEKLAAERRAEALAQAKHHEKAERQLRAKGKELVTKATKAGVHAIVVEKKGAAGAKEAISRISHQSRERKDLSKVLVEVKVAIGKLFHPEQDLIAEKLDAILEFKSEIEESDLKDTVVTLRSLISRVEIYVKRFTPEAKSIRPVASSNRALTNGGAE